MLGSSHKTERIIAGDGFEWLAGGSKGDTLFKHLYYITQQLGKQVWRRKRDAILVGSYQAICAYFSKLVDNVLL